MANWTEEEKERFGTRELLFLVMIPTRFVKTNAVLLSNGINMGIDQTNITWDGRLTILSLILRVVRT